MTQSGPVMERELDREWERGRSAGGANAGTDAAVIPATMAGAGATTDVRRGEQAERDVREALVREALRGQIARLEHESSAIVAGGFPHIFPPQDHSPLDPSLPDPGGSRHAILAGRHADLAGSDAALAGPRLLTLAELERVRDRLVGHTQDLRRLAAERVEHERRARELLEAMKLEPGRHRFARLPVRDLGEGGCGVWEVRPRLGLIGMLAGWWQVKLSSGCP